MLNKSGDGVRSLAARAPRAAAAASRTRLAAAAGSNNESRYGACWPGRVEVRRPCPCVGATPPPASRCQWTLPGWLERLWLDGLGLWRTSVAQGPLHAGL